MSTMLCFVYENYGGYTRYVGYDSEGTRYYASQTSPAKVRSKGFHLVEKCSLVSGESYGTYLYFGESGGASLEEMYKNKAFRLADVYHLYFSNGYAIVRLRDGTLVTQAKACNTPFKFTANKITLRNLVPNMDAWRAFLSKYIAKDSWCAREDLYLAVIPKITFNLRRVYLTKHGFGLSLGYSDYPVEYVYTTEGTFATVGNTVDGIYDSKDITDEIKWVIQERGFYISSQAVEKEISISYSRYKYSYVAKPTVLYSEDTAFIQNGCATKVSDTIKEWSEKSILGSSKKDIEKLWESYNKQTLESL